MISLLSWVHTQNRLFFSLDRPRDDLPFREATTTTAGEPSCKSSILVLVLPGYRIHQYGALPLRLWVINSSVSFLGISQSIDALPGSNGDP